jgi:nicotinamide-nucleotide amidase
MSNSEPTTLIEKSAKMLISKKLSLAFAESATAGRASAAFSLACDAGKFLKGGLVCYDTALKSEVLEVPQELLDKYTPESMEVTQAIARGLAKLIQADIHIGITGLPCAGGSETPEKPVGTMFIFATLHGEQLFAERILFNGTHLQILEQTVQHIAFLLLEHLQHEKSPNNNSFS